MEYRRLGSTGMYVSEISYGNWITHGSQVEQEAAIKCVKTAFDLGITTFDTPLVLGGWEWRERSCHSPRVSDMTLLLFG